jgi:DNA-binding Xre family transcriptional regulator
VITDFLKIAKTRLLNRYWNNKTGAVDVTQLEKIAAALGVQPGDLIVSDAEYAVLDNGQEDDVVQ